MPEIQAIRGLRYDLGQVGSLANVIAPHAAVISPESVRGLYKRHPANVVRLLKHREEPGLSESTELFHHTARRITDWKRQGILREEPDPAIYVYHQEWAKEGRHFVRRGIVTGLALEQFSLRDLDETGLSLGELAEIVFHEYPNLEERVRFLRATKTHVSPVVGVYADANAEVQQILEREVATATPLVVGKDHGFIHRFWPVTDHGVISLVRAAIADRPIQLCSDEEYLAASLFRLDLENRGELTPEHPAHLALSVLFGSREPEIRMQRRLPLYRNVPQFTSREIVELFSPHFQVLPFGKGIETARLLWQELNKSREVGQFGLYCAADDQWVLAALTEEGLKRMEEMTPERDAAWRSLDSSLLEWLVMLELLEAAEPDATYVNSIESLIRYLNEDQSQQFQMAALVLPPTMAQWETVKERGVFFNQPPVVAPLPVCGLVLHQVA